MSTGYTVKTTFSLFLCIVASGACLSVHATTPRSDVHEPAKPLSTVTQPGINYEYILEGRPDPFVPFLTKKASVAQVDPNEIIEEDIELTGMRQFEPGQLTLVAILQATGKKIAMVEDVTGKGYMLNEGAAIGRRGSVTQIDLQQIMITETARTRAGKEVKNTIFMRLNKEGD